MFNPEIKYAHSKGVDLPLMYVYLAGYMSGEKLKECTEWRKRVREHYRKWEKKLKPKVERVQYYPPVEGEILEPDKYDYLAFPIAFLDPFNGKEVNTIDKKGLTSNIPTNAIFHSDRMSVDKADVIVANLDDFFLDDIKDFMPNNDDTYADLHNKLIGLINKVKGYRPSIGTYMELCWAYDRNKAVVLVVPESKTETFKKHPFTAQASWIVGSVDELLNERVLESFYKRISGAIYE